MVESLAIAINSHVRDVILQHRLEDEGDFSKAFSRSVAERLGNGQMTSLAVEDAFRQTGKGFSVLNRRRVSLFKREVVNRIGPLATQPPPMLDLLREFKHYAERTLVNGFRRSNRNEEFCRSNLQTYLERFGITRREVVSGGGLIDILLQESTLIEAKLWRGREYYEAGIEELREYMRTEQRKIGYYIVFDTISDNRDLLDESRISVPEGCIVQVAVRMTPGQPSKRRSAKRRLGEAQSVSNVES